MKRRLFTWMTVFAILYCCLYAIWTQARQPLLRSLMPICDVSNPRQEHTSTGNPPRNASKRTLKGSIQDLDWHRQELMKQLNDEMYHFDWEHLMPLMRQTANESRREERIKAGLAWMRTQRLVVASTVRNAIRGLPDSLKNVDRLRALFNRSWVVLVESDSDDTTREYLHDLTKMDPSVRLLGCGQLNSREPCKPDIRYSSGRKHQPGWYMKRSRQEEIDRSILMAVLRNQYLTYIYDHLVPQGATLLLLMDADMTWFSWDLNNLAQGLYYFGAKPNLQQLCAHTCYANRLHLQDPCTLTFFNNKHFGEDRTKSTLTYDNSIRKASADLPPVKVSSCFQSVAFYRLASMAAGRLMYGGAPGEWICEHNTLSRRLSEVYFDPQMQLNIDQAYVG